MVRMDRMLWSNGLPEVGWLEWERVHVFVAMLGEGVGWGGGEL